MKRVALWIAAAIALTTGLSACTDDPSPSPGDPRSAFVGTWGVTETGAKQYYEVTITLDASSSTAVNIYNFGGSGSGSNPAIAHVSGTNITLVPDMIISDGWKINGNGALTGSTVINWSYSIDFDGADLQYFTAVYNKL